MFVDILESEMRSGSFVGEAVGFRAKLVLICVEVHWCKCHRWHTNWAKGARKQIEL